MERLRHFAERVLVTVALASCGSEPDRAAAPADGGVEASPEARPDAEASSLLADRPYRLAVPEGLDADTAAPLVLLVHGYGVDGLFQAVYLGLLPPPDAPPGTPSAADRFGFLLAYPDGTVDGSGRRFWNATDACCDRDGTGVDDVAYLSAVIDDVRSRHAVDPRRIYVIGHSNGAFMAHRLACDRADVVAGIVAFAGAQWNDASRCQPSRPVGVLVLHGDADDTVLYEGGATRRAEYPSARQTAVTWASKDGCSGTFAGDGTRDLVEAAGVPDTRAEQVTGCPMGGDVALWTIEGGAHIPAFVPAWLDQAWAHLAAHPRE